MTTGADEPDLGTKLNQDKTRKTERGKPGSVALGRLGD